MPSRGLNVVIAGDPRSLQGALAAASGSMTTFEKKMAASSRRLKATGASMTRGLTVPLLAIGGASAKVAADFEESMSKIERLVGVNRKQIEQWSDDLVALGPKVGKSPQELAEALYFVTSAGIDTADALNVTTIAAKASTAGLGETQVVADALTSAINAYGIENLNAAKASDLMIASVREGKQEADEMAPVLGRVIPIAEATGVSFDEVAAAFAALSLTGNDAAISATQIRGILDTLLGPSAKTEEAMKGIGTSVAEVRRQVAQEGLMPAMLELRDRLEDNNVQAGELFENNRALAGFLTLTGKNAEHNSEIFRILAKETGTTGKAFREAADTAEFQLNKAMALLQGSAIQLGDAILPVLVPIIGDLAGVVGDAASAFSHLDPEMQRMIVVSGLAVAGLGPLLSVMGHLLGLAAATPGRMRQVGQALAFIGTPAGALLALGAAIVILGDHWDELEDTGEAFVGTLSDLTSGIGSLLSPLGSLASVLGGLAGGFLESQAAADLLQGILAGALVYGIGRLVVLVGTLAVKAFKDFAFALATMALRAEAAGGAMALLTGAMATNPITLLAIGIGAVVTALGLFSGGQREASASAEELNDALRDQRDLLQQLRDSSLDVREARLREDQAARTLEVAEQNLRKVKRKTPHDEAAIEDATLAVRDARIQLTRATKESNRADNEAAQNAREVIRKNRDIRDSAEENIESLRGEIESQRDNIKVMRLHGMEGEQLTDEKEELRKKIEELRRAHQQEKKAIDNVRDAQKVLNRNTAGTAGVTAEAARIVGQVTNSVLAKFGADPLHFSVPTANAVTASLGAAAQALPFSRGGRVPGNAVVDGVPAMLRGGERVLTPEVHFPIADMAMRIAFGTGLDSMLAQTGAIMGFARGGMVDPAWDPGAERLAASISPVVGAWAARYKADMTAGYDPGGGHVSPGHNVTGTATDMVPRPGWTPDATALFERGLRALVAQGLSVLYGTDGIGTSFPNHGRFNHAHIEWGSGAVMPTPRIPRIRVRGPDSMPRHQAQLATDRMRRAANRYLEKHLQAVPTAPGGADRALGKVQAGNFLATAYGPPWGGIQGTGVTATGIDLRSGPPAYIIATDPNVIPTHSRVRVQPNPFGYTGAFRAEDTGGAITGNRLDFYDWYGRAHQNAWGSRQVRVSAAARGGVAGGMRVPGGLGVLRHSLHRLHEQIRHAENRLEHLRGADDREVRHQVQRHDRRLQRQATFTEELIAELRALRAEVKQSNRHAKSESKVSQRAVMTALVDLLIERLGAQGLQAGRIAGVGTPYSPPIGSVRRA